MARPTSQIIRAVKRAGWVVTHTRGNHYRARNPDGPGLVFFASTPSKSSSVANTIAMLKRHGCNI